MQQTAKRLVKVAPDTIIVDETIGYREYDSPKNQEKTKELAESIAARGLETPLAGFMDSKGSPHLVAGFRRLRAIKMLRAQGNPNFDKVDFIVGEEKPPVEVMFDSIASNEQSEPTTLETALGATYISKKFRVTQQVLAERLGKSQATVAKLLFVGAMPDDILDAIRKDEISARYVMDKMGLKPEKAVKEIRAELKAGGKRQGSKAGGRNASTGPKPNEIIDALTWANQDFFAEYAEAKGVGEKAKAADTFAAAWEKLAKKYKYSPVPEYDEEEAEDEKAS